MYGSGYPTYPNVLAPYPKLFSSFWSNWSSEKENGRQSMHFKGFLSLILKDVKTIVLSKDIKIIFFATFSYFLTVKSS